MKNSEQGIFWQITSYSSYHNIFTWCFIITDITNVRTGEAVTAFNLYWIYAATD